MTKKAQPVTFFQRSKSAIIGFCKSTKNFAISKWRDYQPQVAKFSNITTAATSATSTFKLTFDFLPVISAMLAIVAAAPLFNFLVPEFLYSAYFYVPAIICVSALTGYMKHEELIERAKLDHQIKENQQVNEKLSKTITKLEKALAANQSSWHRHKNVCDSKQKTHCTKTTSTRLLRSSTVSSKAKEEKRLKRFT